MHRLCAMAGRVALLVSKGPPTYFLKRSVAFKTEKAFLCFQLRLIAPAVLVRMEARAVTVQMASSVNAEKVSVERSAIEVSQTDKKCL